MTEAASFDVNRFKPHIELYNYCSVSENDVMYYKNDAKTLIY